jgi:CDP-diacylglycerol--serine O-phosphatidyltransferase
MSVKNYIPNAVTLLNLLSGSVAVVFAVHNNFVAAAAFVFLGIFFDFFDGLLARKLNVQSELGVQLDSLADMVTSGLVPGIVMFKLISMSINAPEIVTQDNWSSNVSFSDLNIAPIALIGLFVTLASAYRLAKFNIDEEQQSYFKGLPTPANTLLIMSLPLIIEFQNSNIATSLILNQWFLIGFTLVSCYLLNSNIKLFALKFKDFSVVNNRYRYVLIIATILLLVLFHFIAIPIIILLYILLSLLDNLTTK